MPYRAQPGTIDPPHQIGKLQPVVHEVSLPMWMPSPYSGTSAILVWGPSGPTAQAVAPPPPKWGCTIPHPIRRHNTKTAEANQPAEQLLAVMASNYKKA